MTETLVELYDRLEIVPTSKRAPRPKYKASSSPAAMAARVIANTHPALKGAYAASARPAPIDASVKGHPAAADVDADLSRRVAKLAKRGQLYSGAHAMVQEVFSVTGVVEATAGPLSPQKPDPASTPPDPPDPPRRAAKPRQEGS